VGENVGEIVNLSDSRAKANRQGIVEFLSQHPDIQIREMRRLVMDRGHEIQPRHVDSKRLDALLLPGVGPRTVQVGAPFEKAEEICLRGGMIVGIRVK
jgi:hypothetical protein